MNSKLSLKIFAIILSIPLAVMIFGGTDSSGAESAESSVTRAVD